MKIQFSILLVSSVLFYCVVTNASPYAPEKVGTTKDGSQIGHYTYDTVGNRLSDGYEQTIGMGLNTKPVTIRAGGETETFRYGLGGIRKLRVHADGRKTFYVGQKEYRLEDGMAKSIVHVRVKGYSPIAQVDTTDSDNLQYTYFIQDHLGSPVCSVRDMSGLKDCHRYAPWGEITEATGVAEDLSVDPKAAEATRGFTGHENIASNNLLHMNGRVYAANIGHFISPDPFIARNLQSLNRYSYVRNSPLNATDPTGYVAELNRGNNLLTFTVPRNRPNFRRANFSFERYVDEGSIVTMLQPSGGEELGRVMYVTDNSEPGITSISVDEFELDLGRIYSLDLTRFREEFFSDLIVEQRGAQSIRLDVLIDQEDSFYSLRSEQQRAETLNAIQSGHQNRGAVNRQTESVFNNSGHAWHPNSVAELSDEVHRAASSHGFSVAERTIWLDSDALSLSESHNDNLFARFRLDRAVRSQQGEHAFRGRSRSPSEMGRRVRPRLPE